MNLKFKKYLKIKEKSKKEVIGKEKTSKRKITV